MKSLSIFILVISITCLASAMAAQFDITNRCPYTLWAAAMPGGGGRQLNSGEAWTIDIPAGTAGARIWARTNCNFDSSGKGHCKTGDCNGVLNCTSYGTPPNTLAEVSLNQFNNLEFFDISLVDGFNVPLEFIPTSNGCSTAIRCTADINGQCPNELKMLTGGHPTWMVLDPPMVIGRNNPCTVFKTDQYCCTSAGSCNATDYSKFFKDRCPYAYSYPMDDKTSTFTCPAGANYRVVFCP